MPKTATKENLPEWNLKDFYDDYKSHKVEHDIKKLEGLIARFTKAYNGKVE